MYQVVVHLEPLRLDDLSVLIDDKSQAAPNPRTIGSRHAVRKEHISWDVPIHESVDGSRQLRVTAEEISQKCPPLHLLVGHALAAILRFHRMLLLQPPLVHVR
jgi:hypothetical protein